ncbi:MAG: hypothetical protein IJM71_06570 [Clostridia bacterium]|nr:hypothetical protein [Clostridia bacterium]MBR3416766.1 hypothetical protein [Clostridia bacterium]
MTGKAASVLSGLILSLLLISCAPRNGAFDRADVQSEYEEDDSGVGASHLEPIVGDFEVELLHDVIVRIINEYKVG